MQQQQQQQQQQQNKACLFDVLRDFNSYLVISRRSFHLTDFPGSPISL